MNNQIFFSFILAFIGLLGGWYIWFYGYEMYGFIFAAAFIGISIVLFMTEGQAG